MTETEIIDSNLSSTKERRRKLLPIWIKIFLWIFMVFGAIAPVGVVLGAIGIDFNLAIYGLETTNALSITGLLIILFFAIKGTVSFGLWTEERLGASNPRAKTECYQLLRYVMGTQRKHLINMKPTMIATKTL